MLSQLFCFLISDESDISQSIITLRPDQFDRVTVAVNTFTCFYNGVTNAIFFLQLRCRK